MALIKIAEKPETWVQTQAIKEMQVIKDKLEIGLGPDHSIIVHERPMETLQVILATLLNDNTH